MNFEKEYKNVFEHAKSAYGTGAYDDYTLEQLFPQLKETEDERIRKTLIDALKTSKSVGELKFILPEPTRKDCIAYLEKQKEQSWMPTEEEMGVLYKLCYVSTQISDDDDTELTRLYQDLKREYFNGRSFENMFPKAEKEQKPIKMEVYEVGKGTTICGQDYKCKKDYKEGNCWYIKDVVYHCSRDGYLTDQNGISWSCTPEWFKEYIQSNTEWAEEEKTHFVSGQFLQCKLSFDGFKEGEHYWLEYVGNDMYVGRSDNILNQKFHITPRQLFTLFSQELEEVQGPPQEEKQVSLNYEPPFTENPSDKEIIEALIHHLNEQDGFLTAINCVSTKAILSWLEKQKVDIDKLRRDLYQSGYNDGYQHGKEDAQKEQKPVEWDDYTETNLDRALQIIKNAKGNLQGYQSDDGIYECDKAIECIEHILYRGINIDAEWAENNYPKDIEKDATQFCFDKGINITPSQAKQIAMHYLMIGHNDGYVEGRKNAHIPAKKLGLPKSMDYKQEWSEEDESFLDSIEQAIDSYYTLNHAPQYHYWLEQKLNYQTPITEVMGFKVGDVVRLKDGDGRHHVIKSFEKVAGIHGSDFYRVEFEDNSARDHIFPDDYPNHTQMVKI